MSDSVSSDSRLSTIFKGSTVLFLGLILELGLSFVAKLLIARYLGRVDYGAVSIGIVTMSFATTILVGGFNTGIGRYLPRYDDPEERRGVLVSAFQMVVPVAVVAGLAVAWFAPWIARNAFHDISTAPVLRIFGLVIPIAVFVKLSIGAVQGMQESLPKVYINNLAIPAVRFGGVAVVIVLGLGMLGVAWAYLVSYASAAVLGLYYLAKKTTLLSRDVSYVSKHRELLVFSAPLFISAAMSFVFAQVDMLLLGYFSATGDVGVYNVVYPIAHLLTAGLSAVGFIFLPVVSELHSEGATADMRRLYQTVTKWLATATLPLFLIFVLFPRMTIKLTFGPEYLVGATTLSVLAIAFFSHNLLGPNSRVLASIGETRFIMYATSFAAAVNVALNLVLIPRFSFFGAALATAISYAALNFAYSALLYRVTGIHPFSRALFVPVVIGAVTVSLIYVITTTVFVISAPLLIVMFGVFILLYGIAVLRFGIEDEEIMLVLRFEDRYDVDLGPFKTIARRLIGMESGDRN